MRTPKPHPRDDKRFAAPDWISDTAFLETQEPTYREVWALPLAAGASVLGLMNIVANVPKPDEAIAACFPAGVMLLLATVFGFLGAACTGNLHRITLHRLALRKARSRPDSAPHMAEIEAALELQRERHVGWATAYVCYTLASMALLIGGWATLAIGFMLGGRLQP